VVETTGAVDLGESAVLTDLGIHRQEGGQQKAPKYGGWICGTLPASVVQAKYQPQGKAVKQAGTPMPVIALIRALATIIQALAGGGPVDSDH